MPTTIGPHLLGRKPSRPDDRNYPMSAALKLDLNDPNADLILAMAALQKSGAAGATKRWAQIATNILTGTQPVPPPSPNPPPPPAPSTVIWNDNVQLDQGNTGHCVGFGSAAWGIADPVNDSWTNQTGHDLYYACKVVDNEAKQENGSTVHSAGVVLKNMGRIDAYVWSSKVEEVALWIQTKGPVIVGTDWTDDMFNPDPNGKISITGSIAGGHCYLLLGVDTKNELLFMKNSWGSSWGVSGGAHFTFQDFQSLLDGLGSDPGEALAGLELPLVA